VQEGVCEAIVNFWWYFTKKIEKKSCFV